MKENVQLFTKLKGKKGLYCQGKGLGGKSVPYPLSYGRYKVLQRQEPIFKVIVCSEYKLYVQICKAQTSHPDDPSRNLEQHFKLLLFSLVIRKHLKSSQL